MNRIKIVRHDNALSPHVASLHGDGTNTVAKKGGDGIGYSGDGDVSEVDLQVSHRQPKLVPVDKQADHDVMHLHRFRKANRLTGKTLDPGA